MLCVLVSSLPPLPTAGVSAAMRREEAQYPAQSALTYLRRVLKCTMLWACTSPLLFGVLVHLLQLLDVDHDKVKYKETLKSGHRCWDGCLQIRRSWPSSLSREFDFVVAVVKTYSRYFTRGILRCVYFLIQVSCCRVTIICITDSSADLANFFA